ncbi:MAG: DoxX family protein [Flavobacteriaceae bacterium]|nr:DoxX family protein [Flavobacteriaceae bacterium]
MDVSKIRHNNSTGLLILRVTIGILILFHGVANLSANYSFIKELLSGIGIPSAFAYGVFVSEILAPFLLVLGYRVRLMALLIAFNFLVAIALAHGPDIFSLNQFGGWGIELPALYLLGALSLFFMGAGRFAISKNSVWD